MHRCIPPTSPYQRKRRPSPATAGSAATGGRRAGTAARHLPRARCRSPRPVRPRAGLASAGPWRRRVRARWIRHPRQTRALQTGVRTSAPDQCFPAAPSSGARCRPQLVRTRAGPWARSGGTPRGCPVPGVAPVRHPRPPTPSAHAIHCCCRRLPCASGSGRHSAASRQIAGQAGRAPWVNPSWRRHARRWSPGKGPSRDTLHHGAAHPAWRARPTPADPAPRPPSAPARTARGSFRCAKRGVWPTKPPGRQCPPTPRQSPMPATPPSACWNGCGYRPRPCWPAKARR
ncbi:hypothetical protein D3C71_1136760 [compost metagenome]